MLFAVDYNGNKVRIDETSSNQEYYCISCGAPLITKKGDIRQHHFAHTANRQCADSWERTKSYDDSEWHTSWQSEFPKANQEIRLSLGQTIHRADVLIGRTVIEFQHSMMNHQTFDERSSFYTNLDYKVVWLFDMTELMDSGTLSYVSNGEELRFTWNNPKKAFVGYNPEHGDRDLFFQISNEDNSCIVRVKSVSERGFEEFSTSSLMSKEMFLNFFKNDDTFLPPDIPDESEIARYIEFKNKYGIKLNKQQERAVQSVKGNVLLLAVPGSGKTTVLVDRIGYMVKLKNIDPTSILAITFTKNAAKEMEQRYCSRFGEIISHVSFCTINSLANSIYKEFCSFSGKETRKLLTNNKQLIREAIKKASEENTFISDNDVLDMQNAISAIKNDNNHCATLSEDIEDAIPEFRKKYQEYQGLLIKSQQMDYDDQLVFAHSILSKNSEFAEKWRRKYKYICVDEAQDTSRIQHDIIKLLAEHNNLFMVGDEDQSIYGFRGAFPRALLNFRYEYNNPFILRIEINYRSTPEIVEAAQRFISANLGRYKKNMIADRTIGEQPSYISVANRTAQYQALLDIAKTAESDTAFLYRDNESAIAIADMMLKSNIGFNLKKPEINFFKCRTVLEILSYFSLVINPFDAKAFSFICNKGIVYIKSKQKEYALKSIKPGNCNVFDAFQAQMAYVEDKYKHRAEDFKRLIETISAMKPEKAIDEILDSMDNRYKEEYIDCSKAEILKMLAADHTSFQSFFEHLQTLEKIIQDGIQSENPDAITLSTIHSAKGLEYNRVYMIDVYDGRFPSSQKNLLERSKDGANGEMEERRLFYVGITRAKNNLAFFDIADKPSQYLNEVFPEIEQKRKEALLQEQKRLRDEMQREQQIRFDQMIKEQRERAEARRAEAERTQKIAEETRKAKAAEAQKQKEAAEKADYDLCLQEIMLVIDNQDEQATDHHGRRWIKCEVCGDIKLSDFFASYGGPQRMNLGTCSECARKQRASHS